MPAPLIYKPSLWYPPGAGGMWLNYLVWCGKNNRIIPGDHSHFEWPHLFSIEPKYIPYFEFCSHDKVHKTAAVRLGSQRAQLNFFLNVINKKEMSQDFSSSVYGAKMFLEWELGSVDFNLDWCLIFENPERFVAQLNSITDFELEFNPSAKQAIEQYRKSCVKIETYTEVEVQGWRQAILNLYTDRQQPLPQRLQLAEEIFYNTYYRI